MPKRKVDAQEEDANLAIFGSEFQNTQTLLLSEVKVFLEIFRDQERSKGLEMQEIMSKTLEYCSKFSKFSNKQTVKEIRSLFPSDIYHEFEMAQLANLTCESAEEAKLLIPSLERIDDEELTIKLNELTNLRQYQ